MKTILPTETFVYYDGVAVFAGADPVGNHYIGMIIDASGAADSYLVTEASPEMLRRFRSGDVDLRTLFLQSPDEKWYISRAEGGPGDPLVLEPQSGTLLETDYLPDEGFVLKDYAPGELALQQAGNRGNAINN